MLIVSNTTLGLFLILSSYRSSVMVNVTKNKGKANVWSAHMGGRSM